MPNQKTINMEISYNNNKIEVARTWDNDSKAYIINFSYNGKNYIDSFGNRETTVKQRIRELIEQECI